MGKTEAEVAKSHHQQRTSDPAQDCVFFMKEMVDNDKKIKKFAVRPIQQKKRGQGREVTDHEDIEGENKPVATDIPLLAQIPSSEGGKNQADRNSGRKDNLYHLNTLKTHGQQFYAVANQIDDIAARWRNRLPISSRHLEKSWLKLKKIAYPLHLSSFRGWLKGLLPGSNEQATTGILFYHLF